MSSGLGSSPASYFKVPGATGPAVILTIFTSGAGSSSYVLDTVRVPSMFSDTLTPCSTPDAPSKIQEISLENL